MATSRRILAAACAAALAGASWTPRPLDSYSEGTPEPASPPGSRRFWHEESHKLDDGSDLHLSWQVDAEPETILALDLEHREEGVRLLECGPRRLLLEVPNGLMGRARKWRHVTASNSRHGCAHLQEHDLYHRIHSFESVKPAGPSRLDRSTLELTTEELASPAQVFPHISFRYAWMPADIQETFRESNDVKEGELEARRLSFYDMNFKKPSLVEHSSFTPDTTADHNSMLNLAIPKQVSNMGWNWDYDANTTRNPQFKYIFPGGVGYMRLYKPYLKAHFGLNMSFTSHISGIMQSPTVRVNGRLKGWADFNADIATAVDFKKDRSASVLDNVFEHIPIPLLENLTRQETFLRPVKFYFGGTPVTVKPGFSCQMKAYHIGLLKGSLRVGLASKVIVDGLMTFDTQTGLQTNVSAEAHDVSFTPPTWMLFTNHFEMGMMFEPMLWLKGGFGEMKDMEIGFSLRPFYNISIMQQDATAGTASEARELAIYPWRAVGLPAGKSYTIRVGANGQYKKTSNQMSTGVAEFADKVEDFSFGMVEEGDLIGAAIEVSILENGQQPPVATGSAVCQSVVNGKCSPSPVVAKMRVDGQDVEVHLSVVWMENALSILESQIQSLSLRFPSVTISSKDMVKQLEDPEVLANALLRLRRNGRTFSVPLAKKMNSVSFLKSRVVIELGPSFLDAWKSMTPYQPVQDTDSDVKDPTVPLLELVVNGRVAGRGAMPPVQWDMASSKVNSDVLDSDVHVSMTPVPTMVPLYSEGEMIGTSELEIDVMPAEQSAFWIFPFQAQDFVQGHTYDFAWTTHGAEEGVAYNFTLTAQLVGTDGSLTPTAWDKPVSVACTTSDIGLEASRYHGDSTPCAFKVQVSIPAALVGKRAVMTALWLDANMMPHEMVSQPVHFVSAQPNLGRRLSSGAPQWGIESHGSVDDNRLSNTVQTHLAELRKHCNAQDLKYALGAGMNFVEHVKNMMIPMPGMPGSMGGGSSPDWASEPVSLFNLEEEHGKRLSKLLPNSMCAGGACEGMMPGCQRTRVNPINIKQIVFKLSRFFQWKNHVGPKMRHIVAYALALLPSAIKISEKEIADQIPPHNSAAKATVHEPSTTDRPQETTPPEVELLGPSTSSKAPIPQTSPEPESSTPSPTPQMTPRPTPPPTTHPATTDAPTPAPTSSTTTAEPTPQPTQVSTPSPSSSDSQPAPAPSTKTGAPHWFSNDGSFENIAPFEGSGSRRLDHVSGDEAGDVFLTDIDGLDALDGDDVEFDKFTVTIIKPMDYELTEDLLRTIFERSGFAGIEDGREHALGPVAIESFYLRDRAEVDTPEARGMPPVSLQQAFELPDLEQLTRAEMRVSCASSGNANASRLSSMPAIVGAGVVVGAALASVALVLLAVVAAAASRGDYVAMERVMDSPQSPSASMSA